MTFHISGTIGAAMIIATGVAVLVVTNPWALIFAWLMTLSALAWPIAWWAVRRHRADNPPVTHTHVTYQVLNLPDQPQSVGAAVYRQRPGSSRTPLEAPCIKSLPSSRADGAGY